MKRILAIGIPAAILIALVIWRFTVKNAQVGELKGAQSAQRRGGANVQLAPVVARDIVNSLDAVGSVDSPYNVKLSPKVAGRIDYLEVREGTPVTTGQVLVKIDPTQVQAQVLQAEAAVAEAQQRLAQAQLTQGATNVGISSTIRQQQAGVSSAQADYNQVQRNYDATVAQAQATVTDAQAKIDAAEAQVANARANLQAAQANLNNAQVKYNRVATLYHQGFIAAQDVDDARTQVDVQNGAVKVAQGQVDANQQALKSAQATYRSATNNLAIVRRKGVADIAASKAKLTQAKASLDVAAANRAQSPAYQANINALQSAVTAAQGQLRQAQSQLSDTILRSPIDGTVTARAADPGAIASPGTPVLTIQYLKWVYVTSSIPVEYSRVVAVGMPVTFTLDAVPGRTFSAPIAEVNPAADPQSRQFTIRLKIDNPTALLRPGMYARLTVVTSRVHAGAVVPREAVTKGQNGPTVTVVGSDMVAHVTPVTTGAEDPKGIEIKSGVAAGQRVVTLAYQPVKDGQKVREGGAGGQGGGQGGQAGGRGGRGGRRGGQGGGQGGGGG